MNWTLLLLLTICSVRGQQWYMPDSNLISDQEFPQKVTGDSSRFKFVKYFTPHCPYCRYLKAVFDTLKHRKQWCFSIYQLNCQWYPQFCMQNVRSTSFPYTVVYDERGQVYEEIHGFYPEPIIADIFDRIEMLCLNLQKPNTLPAPAPAPAPTPELAPQLTQQQGSLSAEVKQEPKELQSSAQIRQKHLEQPPPPQPAHQTSSQVSQPRNTQQSEPQTSNKTVEATNSHNKQAEAKQLPPYISYAFYGICLIVAAFYIRSLHSNTSETQQSPQSTLVQSKSVGRTECEVREGSKGESEQDSELLEIPDDQL